MKSYLKDVNQATVHCDVTNYVVIYDVISETKMAVFRSSCSMIILFGK